VEERKPTGDRGMGKSAMTRRVKRRSLQRTLMKQMKPEPSKVGVPFLKKSGPRQKKSPEELRERKPVKHGSGGGKIFGGLVWLNPTQTGQSELVGRREKDPEEG